MRGLLTRKVLLEVVKSCNGKSRAEMARYLGVNPSSLARAFERENVAIPWERKNERSAV